jgi:hypothetical protein
MLSFVALLLAAAYASVQEADNSEMIEPKMGEILELTAAAPACLDYDVMMRMSELLEKDTEAAKKLFRLGVEAGQCTTLEKGRRVFVEKTYLPFYTCVRPQGEVPCLYVNRVFLQRPN